MSWEQQFWTQDRLSLDINSICWIFLNCQYWPCLFRFLSTEQPSLVFKSFFFFFNVMKLVIYRLRVWDTAGKRYDSSNNKLLIVSFLLWTQIWPPKATSPYLKSQWLHPLGIFSTKLSISCLNRNPNISFSGFPLVKSPLVLAPSILFWSSP